MACSDYKTLTTAWGKALLWTDGLDCALSVMLASILSTRSVGDQLWIKIISPAASGKSTLCEALSTNKKYVFPKSIIRGFHSGFKVEGGKDASLIAQIKDKTLVTKDGDSLLQSPNLSQILSEARDLYDRVSRTHYRNKVSKDYTGINMTWILCGTSSLQSIDSSELGERFLDCVIMDGIDEDLEDEILWKVVNRASRNLSYESDGAAGGQYDGESAEAMRLTGGYVGHLRENAQQLLSNVKADEKSLRQCIHLGKFVAFMRARLSQRKSRIQDEEVVERELATRLVSQHIRLAKCLAVVLNVNRLDVEVMRRTTKVALDTSRGHTLDVVKGMYKAKSLGLELETIALVTHQTEEKTRKMLRFLSRIGVVWKSTKSGTRGRPRWRLTSRISKLYSEVCSDDKEK